MGVYFDPDTNEYVGSSGTCTLVGTEGTMCGWFQVNSTTGTFRAMGCHTSYECRTSGGTTMLHEFYQGTELSFVMTVDVTYHLAFVWSQKNTLRQLWVNGVLNNENVSEQTWGTPVASNQYIGASATNTLESWDGCLDDFREYNRPLSKEEIETIYACRGNDWIHNGLLCWYPMNEGVEGSTVNTLKDVVGGFDLTVVNGTPQYDYSTGLSYRRAA